MSEESTANNAASSPKPSDGRGATKLNPYAELRCGLKLIVDSVKSSKASFEHARRPIQIADDMPRHDSIVSEEHVKELSTWPCSSFVSLAPWMDRTVRQLARSREAIEDASGSIRGCLRGELKVRTEDRLDRHLAEATELLELYRQLMAAEDVPNQPYLIRQKTMTCLALTVAGDLRDLKALRRALGNGLPENLLLELTEQEVAMIRLRADLTRWRDNPTQKMGKKLQQGIDRLDSVRGSLVPMLELAKAECKRLGIVFHNQAGPVPE